MNYCLGIPRYSQRFEPGEWPAGVLCAGKGSDYWGDRACGLACLRMILAYFGKPVPSQYELLVEGLQRNAYSPKGWIHKGLAELGESYSLRSAPIVIKNGNQLEQILKTTGPVITSVTHTFPEDGRRGGHLVVVCGRHTELEPTITFRDPSRWGASHSTVTEKRFFSSFTGRGLHFSLGS
ncbi:C39 family peptidase [Neobacillus sp. YIM B02564]|uniref:C39 family peptidase n=1 Tax=Neobacillus paridis TaxID=2803862 RepID=A0ABS1TJC7_9BACI|nr:C39 family peptidase [Neobacillus paridis]